MNKIYEIKNYVDKTGKTVIKFEAQTGNSVEFYGSATMITDDKKRIPLQFPFPSEIKTVAACFENFDSILKAFVQKREAEMKEKKESATHSTATTSESSMQEGGKILQFKRPE